MCTNNKFTDLVTSNKRFPYPFQNSRSINSDENLIRGLSVAAAVIRETLGIFERVRQLLVRRY